MRDAPHRLRVHDAHDDAKILIAPHGVRPVHARLKPDLAEQFIKVRDLLFRTEGERIVLRDHECAREVAVFQILVQRVVFVREARIHELRKLPDVRLPRLARQREHLLTDLRECRAVHRLREIELPAGADAEQPVEPRDVRLHGIVRRRELRHLLRIRLRAAQEIGLRLQILLLVAEHPLARVAGDKLLKILEVAPVHQQRAAERERAHTLGCPATQPSIIFSAPA